MIKMKPNTVFNRVKITQTRIIQYRYDNGTGKYKKIELDLSWNDLIYRFAIDLVRVVHRSNGRTLKHGLRTKANIIASIIIWTIYLDEYPFHEERNHIFDWELMRERGLTERYILKRGETEYQRLDQKIYELLTDPSASVFHISKWISEGPDYELHQRNERQVEIAGNQELDRTPDRTSILSLTQPEQQDRKHKKKGLYRRMKSWLSNTIKS